MAAQTITRDIAPRMEFSSPGGGSLLVRVYNTKGGIEWEGLFSTATVLAMFGAALTGASPSISNGGAGGLVYIPKNVGAGANADGRLTSGGQLNPQANIDVA
jgi:hypothetical protein